MGSLNGLPADLVDVVGSAAVVGSSVVDVVAAVSGSFVSVLEIYRRSAVKDAEVPINHAAA